MQGRTLFQCFSLLVLMVILAFIAEFMITPLFGTQVPVLYRIAPVTSIPIWFRQQISPEKGGTKVVPPKHRVMIHLKSGKEITGELISDEEGWVMVNLDGNQVGFRRSEISDLSDLPQDAS